jgi:four helix bundle protein
MPPLFDHEKLRVYQRAISFIVWCEPLFEKLPKTLSAVGQLDRASTSIPLNIAEGNGKFTAADRCQYFDIARGSALECAACLDVLVAKRRLCAEECLAGKQSLADVVSMLVGLIKSTSDSRLFEDSPEYGEGAAD